MPIFDTQHGQGGGGKINKYTMALFNIPCCSELVTSGIVQGCEDNLAGVATVFITDMCSVTEITHNSPDDGIIASITLAGGTQYWEFQPYRETGTFVSTGRVTDTGGNFYEEVVTIKIPKITAAKRTKIAQLTGKLLSVIVKDNNGQYWLVGENLGALLTERPAQTGDKRDSENGYILTITANEPQAERVLDAAVVTALGL